jgi:ABC-type Fe3+-siderophore transport system permease subunit
MRALVVVAVLTLSSSARAEKSEKVATALSGIGAGVSSGLVLSSFLINAQEGEPNMSVLYVGLGTSIITPSLGQLYSEQWLTLGMGIRGAAAALALYGLTQNQDQPCIVDPTENCPTLTGAGFSLIALAAIAYVGGVAVDVRDADDSARRHNQKKWVNAALAPTMMPNGGGGLSLIGRF